MTTKLRGERVSVNEVEFAAREVGLSTEAGAYDDGKYWKQGSSSVAGRFGMKRV